MIILRPPSDTIQIMDCDSTGIEPIFCCKGAVMREETEVVSNKLYVVVNDDLGMHGTFLTEKDAIEWIEEIIRLNTTEYSEFNIFHAPALKLECKYTLSVRDMMLPY